jgi:IS1 family transposase
VNRLSRERRVAILAALTEGTSISATARQVGVSKVTVLKLLAEIGPVCLEYQRKALVNLPCKTLQADEVWSFISCKERNVRGQDRGTWRGDCWTWTAICADTKLIPCWHVGARDAEAARLFMEDLASRLANRVQLTTDGHGAYLRAVEEAFGWNGVDYAMLVKLYGKPMEDSENQTARRYSPPKVIAIEKQWVMGKPDEDAISTSFVERQNLSMRMNLRRLTRLTNGFSKKMENHIHAMALYFMHYNFCRKHQTLTRAKGGVHTTPAMAAHVADHVWKLEEVVALLEEKERGPTSA